MKTMLPNTLKFLVTILLTATLPSVSHATVGQVAEDFELPLFDQAATYSEDKFSLSEHEGKIIVLEWFGWWCPFCPPAARAFHDQVLSKVGSGNSNKVPVEHVVLHVDGVDNQGIADFMREFNLDRVVMDDKREVFKKFHQNSTQPFFVIINGVANSPTSAQWEVLYEHNGYGGSSFPGTTMVSVINSVEAGDSIPSNPGQGTVDPVVVPEKPTTFPEMSVIQPYSNLTVVDQLKDTSVADPLNAPSKLGVIYDATFPNIYSFSLAQLQRDETAAVNAIEGAYNPDHIGWLYVMPEFTNLHSGILAYDYYNKEWIWFAPGSDGRFQILDNPHAGEAGWKSLPTEAQIPTAEETDAFIAALVTPAIPEGLDNTNPLSMVPIVEGKKDLQTLGFKQLGMVDDTSYPLINSDVLTLNQSGINAGWAYVLAQPSSSASGLLAFLYEGNQWVWFPKDKDLWYFGFAFPEHGFSGWNKNRVPSPVEPTIDEKNQFQNQTTPVAEFETLGGGNPFAGIASEDGVKDSSTLGSLNLGWIDDSQYPFVYSYDLAKNFEGEDAGWIYFNDNSSIVSGGVLAYLFGNSGWHWIPAGLDGLSVNLSHPSSGLTGWNRYPSSGIKPTLEERIAKGGLAVPEFMPIPTGVSLFHDILGLAGAKNTQIAAQMDWGLGWVNDSHYPYVYSYDQAKLQVETVLIDGIESTQTKEHAGWYYVLETVSEGNSGALLYSFSEKYWIWIPANGSGRFFNLSRPQTGEDGWFRLLSSEEETEPQS